MAYKFVPVSERIVYDTTGASAIATNAVSSNSLSKTEMQKAMAAVNKGESIRTALIYHTQLFMIELKAR